MANLFSFLENHVNGVILFLVSISLLFYVLAKFIDYLARVFCFGRYDGVEYVEKQDSKVGYVVVQFFVGIINDFKHFLAMLMVLIFTVLIIYTMTTTSNFDQKMEGLQTIIASLGGLLGSIIGYYFGESAAKGNNTITTKTVTGNVIKEEDPDEEMIQPIDPPIKIIEE